MVKYFPQAYAEAIVDFRNLFQKLKDLNANMIYPKNDKRYGTLQSLLKIVMWILMEIEEFLPVAKGDTSKYRRKFNLDQPNSIKFAKSIDIFLRASFIALFMFQVEVLLRTIRDKLPIKSKSNKYYDISLQVLKKTHPIDWKQKHDVLKAPSLIRNCLHNEGTHTKKYEKVTVRGVDYEFFENQKCNFTSWDYLFIFMDELVNVLKEIVTSSVVQKIGLIKS